MLRWGVLRGSGCRECSGAASIPIKTLAVRRPAIKTTFARVPVFGGPAHAAPRLETPCCKNHLILIRIPATEIIMRFIFGANHRYEPFHQRKDREAYRIGAALAHLGRRKWDVGLEATSGFLQIRARALLSLGAFFQERWPPPPHPLPHHKRKKRMTLLHPRGLPVHRAV